MRKREPWLCYRRARCEREQKVSGTTSLIWPLILKAALPGNGRIGFRKDNGPASHLRQILGGRPKHEGRFYETAIEELVRVGMIAIDQEAIVITEWRDFLPRHRRSADELDSRRWVRLFGFESPSFRRLPPMVRGFAHWLLREVRDEDGTVIVDEAYILDQLGWLYGHEYRHLKQAGYVTAWIASLRSDGYLGACDSDQGLARIRNFRAMQPTSSSAERAEPAVNRGSTGSEPVVNGWSTGGEHQPKAVESFTSDQHEGMKEGRKDQIPPNPPGTGGGQAELFSGRDPAAEPRRAAHATVRRRHAREPRMPAAVPMPPSGFPARFETAFAAYPNHRGTKIQAHGVWLVLAAELGEQVLFDRVMEHLAWKVPTHWADGIGVPYFERYLHKRQWSDPKPANPDAEKPAARGAARDFEAERREREKQARANALAASSARTARAIEAERAERAAEPSREEAARQRALDWTDFRKDRNCAGLGYHAPADPAIAAVVNAVMAQRVTEFRAAYPAQPLPKILREYLAAQEVGIVASEGPATPARGHHEATTPAAAAPPLPLPPPAPPRRAHIPAGAWPPRFTDAPGAGVVGLRLVGQPAAPAPDPALELLQRLQRLGGRVERLEAKTQPSAAGGRG